MTCWRPARRKRLRPRRCHNRAAVKLALQRPVNFGFVGLVGVQSNRYPRSLDIARPLREAGIAVVIGGFHVSGMLAMFPKVMDDLQQALDIGVTLFAGEAEGRMDGGRAMPSTTRARSRR